MLIVIPAYNEEKNIGALVDSLVFKYHYHVIVVNDGSTDKTASIAARFGAIVIQKPNTGYYHSLVRGYQIALQYDSRIVQMDADGQHDPGSILDLYIPICSNHADIVIGSRFYGNYPISFAKAVGVMFFRRIIHRFTGLAITDPTSGFQAMNKRAMEFYINTPMKYPDANAIIRAHRAGLRIMEVPVKMHPNPQGRTMHRGFTHLARYMANVMGEILREGSDGKRKSLQKEERRHGANRQEGNM